MVILKQQWLNRAKPREMISMRSWKSRVLYIYIYSFYFRANNVPGRMLKPVYTLWLKKQSNSTVRRSPKQLLESRRHRNAKCGWRWVIFRSTRTPQKGTAQTKVVICLFQQTLSLIFIWPFLARCSRRGEALVVQSSTFSRCCHPFGFPDLMLEKFAPSSAWWCAGVHPAHLETRSLTRSIYSFGADLVKFGALTGCVVDNISSSDLELLNLWFHRHLGFLTCMLVDEWLVECHDFDFEWFWLNLSYMTHMTLSRR